MAEFAPGTIVAVLCERDGSVYQEAMTAELWDDERLTDVLVAGRDGQFVSSQGLTRVAVRNMVHEIAVALGEPPEVSEEPGHGGRKEVVVKGIGGYGTTRLTPLEAEQLAKRLNETAHRVRNYNKQVGRQS